MRTQAQIRHQLKQVTFRHLQKRLRKLFKQRPTTCQHNREVPLDEDGSYVRLCGVLSPDGVPRDLLCDPRIAGCNDVARECPLWEPLQTKDQVKAEFHAVVQSGDRGIIAADFPDIAALMWVLDDPNDVPSEDEIEALADPPAHPSTPPASELPRVLRAGWRWPKFLGGRG
jgi:hypothetical protein